MTEQRKSLIKLISAVIIILLLAVLLSDLCEATGGKKQSIPLGKSRW